MINQASNELLRKAPVVEEKRSSVLRTVWKEIAELGLGETMMEVATPFVLPRLSQSRALLRALTNAHRTTQKVITTMRQNITATSTTRAPSYPSIPKIRIRFPASSSLDRSDQSTTKNFVRLFNDLSLNLQVHNIICPTEYRPKKLCST